MASKAAPPTLQIAQILADLSDLNVADPLAALALVTAHRRDNTTSNSKVNRLSLSTSSSYVYSPSERTPGTLSRTLSRNDSSASGNSMSTQWERYGTPSAGEEVDLDLERAQTLMQLYEIRGRFKQQESGGLARARANVEAVAQRYAARG